jgi:hypothetical protein
VKYMCLVYASREEDLSARVLSDFPTTVRAMREAGVYLGSGRLKAAGSATTVRVRDGETLLTDGPFAEIKEHLGGYFILECDDLDEAVRWVSTIPGSRVGAIEVRPLEVAMGAEH